MTNLATNMSRGRTKSDDQDHSSVFNTRVIRKQNSCDGIPNSNELVRQANSYCDKAILHLNKQEYFGVLKKC